MEWLVDRLTLYPSSSPDALLYDASLPTSSARSAHSTASAEETTPLAQLTAAVCRAAAVTRPLHLLRAHGIVRKAAKSHRDQVRDKGRTLLTAFAAARQADTKKRTQAA